MNDFDYYKRMRKSEHQFDKARWKRLSGRDKLIEYACSILLVCVLIGVTLWIVKDAPHTPVHVECVDAEDFALDPNCK